MTGWTRGLGTVTVAPFDVALELSLKGTGVQPNAVFIEQRLLAEIVGGRLAASPSLVVDVLPDDRERRPLRQTQSLRPGRRPGILVANQRAETLVILTLRDGRFEPLPTSSDETITSQVLGGLVVDPATIRAAVARRAPHTECGRDL